MRRLHHICIQSDKYEESVKFYTDILGFDLVKETKNFHGRLFNSWLQQGELMIELQTNKGNEPLKKNI
jgi:glyoxylase I family protein